MGVATLTDMIGSLLLPDNVTVLAAMTMTEIASTVCETLNMSHVIFLVCQVCLLKFSVPYSGLIGPLKFLPSNS